MFWYILRKKQHRWELFPQINKRVVLKAGKNPKKNKKCSTLIRAFRLLTSVGYLVNLYFLDPRRRFRSNMTLESLHSVLDALVPKCSELVAGCQTGSGAILRGGNCCRLLFEDKLVYRYVLTIKQWVKQIFCLLPFTEILKNLEKISNEKWMALPNT